MVINVKHQGTYNPLHFYSSRREGVYPRKMGIENPKYANTGADLGYGVLEVTCHTISNLILQ